MMNVHVKKSLLIQFSVAAFLTTLFSSTCWIGICEVSMSWIDFSDPWVLAGLIVLVSVTSVAGLFFIISNKVLQPLHMIASYNVQQATEGRDSDVPVLIPEASIPSGVIGEIMRTRNAMLTRLSQSLHEIRENNKRIQALEQMKDDLSRMVVHDLKNPLGVILLTLEHVQRIEGQDRMRLLRLAQKSGYDMLEMIQSLLDIGKMEEGKLALKLKPVDLHVVGSAIIAEFNDSGIPQGRSLTFDDGEKAVVVADEDLITRVLKNLISNAVKCTRPDGRISLRIEKPGGDSVRIGVKDNGIGISKEDATRIFEKFEQIEHGQPQQRTGSGLGLTFCKLAVEAHGGRVWVESEPNHGSTFFVELPLNGSHAGAPSKAGEQMFAPAQAGPLFQA